MKPSRTVIDPPPHANLPDDDSPVHLRFAIRETRVLLSGNHDDFEFLHDLIIEAQGHHQGILIVRRDNKSTRDLTPKGIVRATSNLLTGQIPLPDQFLVLNHWR